MLILAAVADCRLTVPTAGEARWTLKLVAFLACPGAFASHTIRASMLRLLSILPLHCPLGERNNVLRNWNSRIGAHFDHHSFAVIHAMFFGVLAIAFWAQNFITCLTRHSAK